MSEATMIGKLTIRTMKVTPAKHVVEGQTTPVAVIFGNATGIKTIEDRVRGDVYQALTGDFEGVNQETNEFFNSGILYLPKGIHELIENGVKQLKEKGDSVKFALGIGVVKASNPAGYSYEAVSLVPAAVVDPLADLRSKALEAAKSKMKTLPSSTNKK